MSTSAFSLSEVDRLNRIASKRINSRRYLFQMDRIATMLDLTKMIDLSYLQSSRQWTYQPSVHKSMDLDGLSAKFNVSVSTRLIPHPQPALSFCVNFDFPEDSRQFCG